jgi:hypothetical protein
VAGRAGVSVETVRQARKIFNSNSQVAMSMATACCAQASRSRTDSNVTVLTQWRDDTAFQADASGRRFAEWFERTDVGPDADDIVKSIPLGRIYEIVDEARRRSRRWNDLAERIESRARYQAQH